MKKIISGKIEENSINDQPIIDLVEEAVEEICGTEDGGWGGAGWSSKEKLYISWYITNRLFTEEEIIESRLRYAYGNIEGTNCIVEAYSDFTPGWLQEDLKIGEHDIYKIIENADEQYLLMIISDKKI